MNNSDWFKGLKYAESLHKNEEFTVKGLEDEYWHEVRHEPCEEFSLGFLDYIHHLEHRLCLQP